MGVDVVTRSCEEGADCRRVNDVVYVQVLNRGARHVRIQRTLRALHDGEATMALDVLEPDRTIAERSGEYDADYSRAI